MSEREAMDALLLAIEEWLAAEAAAAAEALPAYLDHAPDDDGPETVLL